MSKSDLPSVPMNGLPGAGPLSRSKIEPYVFGRRFETEKQNHPFSPRYLGRTNPYTQCAVNSKADYYEYLREHTYLMMCDELVVKQTQEIRETAQNEITWLKNQNAYLIQSSSDTDTKLRRLRRLCILLAIVLVLSFFAGILVKNHAYNSGLEIGQERGYASGLSDQTAADAEIVDKAYSAGEESGYAAGVKAGFADGQKDGYTDGQQNGYSSGQRDGYKEGKREGYNEGYWEGYADAGKRSTGSSGNTGSSSGGHTGTGSSRDTPIANTYIGNKSSKKFHLPTCSYLPDQKNQITFASREEAIAAGYDPCGHCHP